MKIDKDKLSSAMAVKGVFVQDLCKRANVSEHIIKQILSGGVGVDATTVSRIAWVLSVEHGELEERAGEGVE